MSANENARKPTRRATYVRKISQAEKTLTTSRPSDVSAFAQWSAFFRARHRRRMSGDWGKRDAKPAERKVHALKQDLYQYLVSLKRKRGIGKLKRFIKARDGSRWSGHAESDAAWVIRLVETDPDIPVLNKSQRYRMRLEMELAAQHNIDHHFLAAFLRETGDVTAIRTALENAERLSWARKYVLARPTAADAST